MLRSTAINLSALLIVGLLGSATLAATLTSTGAPVAEVAQSALEPAVETAEPGPETPDPEPVVETGELEPAPENGEAGFGAVRSGQARAFGECMREHGGQGQGSSACAEHKPGPAHETPGHPGRGPENRSEHAGQGKPEHAGQGKPEHAGQGKPEHAGQGKPDHAGQGKPDHAGQGKPDRASTED